MAMRFYFILRLDNTFSARKTLRIEMTSKFQWKSPNKKSKSAIIMSNNRQRKKKAEEKKTVSLFDRHFRESQNELK